MDKENVLIHRPGGLIFSVTILTIAVLFYIASRFFEVNEYLAPGGIIIGLICISISLGIKAKAFAEDKKRDKRCPDCSTLLSLVSTSWGDSQGKRYDGMGLYCKKCRELKNEEIV